MLVVAVLLTLADAPSSSSLSQASVISDSGEGKDCSSALRSALSRSHRDLTPLALSVFPRNSCWLSGRAGVHLTATLCAPGLREKSQTADSFDRWLWNGARLLWLSSAINSPALFTCPTENDASRDRSLGWHRHSERKPSATLAETKFTWHWTRRTRAKVYAGVCWFLEDDVVKI